MRVLHVIPSLSEAHGGPTRALMLIEQALAAQGVTVETATTDDDGPGRRNGKALGRPVQESGGVHWYFPKRMDFYKASPGFARWIASEVRGYDVIHVHALFSFTSTAAAWAARRADVPYVIRPLGTLNGYGMTQRRRRLKGCSVRLIEGAILRHASAVHFTSDEEAAEARQLGIPIKEVVIPLGVPAASGTAQAGEPRRPGAGFGRGARLLFLSRLDRKKNVEGLLSAIALLREEMPQLHLVVAGSGEPEYVAGLKAHARSLGIDGQVDWVGHVKAESKTAAFAGADIFVLPSYSENFGIAAAEALAAGLPCVLGDGVAIAKDVVQAGAGVAVRTDPTSIADGLRHIIAAHEEFASLSDKARRLARERYSVEAMGASLARLYAQILTR
jgi:glycosyltransferase involved in cell wall biosynthesis